jgi:hypothetical protein
METTNATPAREELRRTGSTVLAAFLILFSLAASCYLLLSLAASAKEQGEEVAGRRQEAAPV